MKLDFWSLQSKFPLKLEQNISTLTLNEGLSIDTTLTPVKSLWTTIKSHNFNFDPKVRHPLLKFLKITTRHVVHLTVRLQKESNFLYFSASEKKLKNTGSPLTYCHFSDVCW